MVLDALKHLVMPPLCLCLAAAVGLALWKRRPRLARGLLGGAFGLLLLFSLPVFASALLISLQGEPPTGELEAGDAQAIVVLGADGASFAPEFGGPGVGALTLERVRYGARLARRTGLPVLHCGGPPRAGESPLADRMAAVLEQEFGLGAGWRETRSANTRQNAEGAAKILRAQGLERVLVVSHAWHLARALPEFRRAGLFPRGAGTGWRELRAGEPGSWIPSARGLRETSWALHEWLGRLWYSLT